ncbi:hypothetical protein BJP34_30220 [Moorena producens PAL-8-15-08-1]|uniref:Uncharacterized protein n=1 Tax=Moorena producens PAL-8-15-08-1 TaxID=1458985 RepID=A0A1D8TZS1_9CYAN|nr:hypothetical protein [Moorena producens]AOX03149.1 hypothetical protein BJP34_30220 [Moorena producens PAL-8-15-08-1]
MKTYQSSISNPNITTQAWKLLANGRFWPFTLLLVGVASNGVYAHAPLAAFASMSGATLSRQRAVGVALLVWLVNQAIGFGLRGYPLTSTAFTWGALMGIGTLLAAVAASWWPGWCRDSFSRYLTWMAIASLLGFALYQGLILFAYPVLADGHRMGWEIVGKLFVKHLIWSGGITIVHSLLLWRIVNRRQSVI